MAREIGFLSHLFLLGIPCEYMGSDCQITRVDDEQKENGGSLSDE